MCLGESFRLQYLEQLSDLCVFLLDLGVSPFDTRIEKVDSVSFSVGRINKNRRSCLIFSKLR